MLLRPRKFSFRSVFKRRVSVKPTYLSKPLRFGDSGLCLCQNLKLNSQKMFRVKLLLKKGARRSEKTSRKLWFLAFPHLPLTKKVLGSRMGKGKGKPHSWVTCVKVTNVLFELKCLRHGRLVYFSNQIALRLGAKHKLIIKHLRKSARLPVLYRRHSLTAFSNF